MKIVIDTNILISALLNTNSNFSEIIFDYSNSKIKFYTPLISTHEIFTHRDKILKITKYSETDFSFFYQSIIKYINVVNCDFLPIEVLKKSKVLVKDVDEKDEDFISLTSYLGGYLWIGDKKLKNGLAKKGFHNVLSTSELPQKISSL